MLLLLLHLPSLLPLSILPSLLPPSILHLPSLLQLSILPSLLQLSSPPTPLCLLSLPLQLHILLPLSLHLLGIPLLGSSLRLISSLLPGCSSLRLISSLLAAGSSSLRGKKQQQQSGRPSVQGAAVWPGIEDCLASVAARTLLGMPTTHCT
jgi:hypothetical protein